jgi:hypothetical protein
MHDHDAHTDAHTDHTDHTDPHTDHTDHTDPHTDHTDHTDPQIDHTITHTDHTDAHIDHIDAHADRRQVHNFAGSANDPHDHRTGWTDHHSDRAASLLYTGPATRLERRVTATHPRAGRVRPGNGA